jgi:hypothetical protein
VFPKHPYTFCVCLPCHLACAIHIGENHGCVLPKVVGSASVVWYLWEEDMSEDRIAFHFLHESVQARYVPLWVRGMDIVELGPNPVACGDYGSNFEVFQEDMLELGNLFMWNVACCQEVEVAVALLVAFFVRFSNPPPSNNGDHLLDKLFKLGLSRRDEEGWGKCLYGCFLHLVLHATIMDKGGDGGVGSTPLHGLTLRASLQRIVLLLGDLGD